MIVTVKEDAIELMPESTIEEVVQNVRMILGIARGTVPIDREFGLRTDLLDAPMPVARSMMAAYVAEDITRYEPRARLISLDFRTGADGRLEPVVKLVIEE